MSTIFALSSGSLPSAIAIFRISGDRSRNVLFELTKRRIIKPRYIFHSKIFDCKGNPFDSAMAAYLPGPSTFTGEDSAEIYIHGSRAIVNCMNERLSSMEGLRHAHAGEFTKRALMNGKVNLSEVNALRALINSTSSRQLDQANRALSEGDWLAKRITKLRARIAIIADFGEYVKEDINDVKRELNDLIEDIIDRKKKGIEGERVRKGIRIVLIGRPNVGKSSIFNRLCGYDRSIVSSISGTTRDSIQVNRDIEGIPVSLEDTAGIHSTDDPIEKYGIDRSFKRIEEADIIIIVQDGSRNDDLQYIRSIIPSKTQVITVTNKADLIDEQPRIDGDNVYTIATSLNGIESLERKLKEVVMDICPSNTELTLSAGLDEVMNILNECQSHNDVGLMSEFVQMADEAWGRSQTNEQVINHIMKDFCIGK